MTRYGGRFDLVRASGLARFAIANPDELSLEEHPFAIDLAIRLEQRGVRIVSFSA